MGGKKPGTGRHTVMILAYYLPGIIFVVLALAALIWAGFFIRDSLRGKRGEATCMYCKAAASKISPHTCLFLLPISFGDVYSDAQSYLRAHMIPIMGKEQIPSGRRACYVDVYSCPRCDKKQITVKDFLQVRGEDYDKGHYVFAYEPFQPLLEAWTNQMNMR